MAARVVVVAVMVAATACYQYRPYAVEAVQPGQVVHATFTPAASSALASAIGPHATTIDGRVVGRVGNDVTLAVTRIERTSGPEQFLKDEPMTLPLASLSAVTVRSADKPRTAVAAGGLLALVIGGQIFVNQSGIFTTRTGPASGTK